MMPPHSKLDLIQKFKRSNLNVSGVLSEGIEKIKEITNQFLNAITESLPKMPYGLRCVGLFLKDALRKSFQETMTKLPVS